MRKKDYITIANALKPFYQNHNPFNSDEVDQNTVKIIQAISKALKQDNPKFDPIKFLEYLRK